MRLDPVLLEILNNKTTAATEEMGLALQRTGRTLYVKETADFGAALATVEGHFFAYPKTIGVSGFLDLDCGPTIAAVEELEPGDVIITNHPYESEGLATHGPDLHLLKPYFHDGKIVCFGWSFIHSSDVGGRVPSSISPVSKQLFEEGFMMPPMKLMRRGEFNADLLRLFKANCRTPDDNMGDIKAMLAALNVGQRRVAAIIEQHGIESFETGQQDLIEYAARKAKAVLKQIPNGTYHFTDYLDDDVVSDLPIRLRVALKSKDGQITLDFTGSDPQVEAALNVPTMGKRHAWLTVRLGAFILSHDETIPYNSGIFSDIDVVVPHGSLLNPRFPAAVGVRHATAIRVNDLLNGALGIALPRTMPACSGGVMIPLVLAEDDPQSGQSKVSVVEPMVGGTGARFGADGVDGRDSSISNMANNPIEMVEADSGVVVQEYALRSDSGGAGKWRGGVGLKLTVEVLNHGGQILARGMERFRFGPWGRHGGKAASLARTVLNMDSNHEHEIGKIDVLSIAKGDRLTVMTPGGGGFGDPFQRDPALVLQDVRLGFVSEEAARADFGVAIRGGVIDTAETRRLRENGRSENENGHDFGEARNAWEAAIDAASMDELNRILIRLPTSLCQRQRQDILTAVAQDLNSADGETSLPRIGLAGRLAALRRLVEKECPPREV